MGDIFCKVTIALWLISFIGSSVNFLTLVYIGESVLCNAVVLVQLMIDLSSQTGVLLSFSVPVLYDKNQASIDEWMNAAYRIASKIAST